MREEVDWRSLTETLAAACDEPDEATAERAVRAAELVAATAGEPPDDLSDSGSRVGGAPRHPTRPSSSSSRAAR